MQCVRYVTAWQTTRSTRAALRIQASSQARSDRIEFGPMLDPLDSSSPIYFRSALSTPYVSRIPTIPKAVGNCFLIAN